MLNSSNVKLQHRRPKVRVADKLTATIVIIDDAARCLTPEMMAKFEAMFPTSDSKWFTGYFGDDPDAVVA